MQQNDSTVSPHVSVRGAYLTRDTRAAAAFWARISRTGACMEVEEWVGHAPIDGVLSA